MPPLSGDGSTLSNEPKIANTDRQSTRNNHEKAEDDDDDDEAGIGRAATENYLKGNCPPIR